MNAAGRSALFWLVLVITAVLVYWLAAPG